MSLSNQVKSSLSGLIAEIKRSEGEIQVLASTVFIGIADRRIFNNQTGSENAAGETLGVYSSAYKKQKSRKYGGSLAAKVNLFASGTLFGSVKQVKDSEGTYVSVTDTSYPKGKTNTVKVAGYLEQQYGNIFEPTVSETKAVIDTVNDWVSKKTDEYFKQ